MTPPVPDHVTDLFGVPPTVVVNCWLPPTASETELGETVTLMLLLDLFAPNETVGLPISSASTAARYTGFRSQGSFMSALFGQHV
jgi:hypothetical protein